MRNKSARLLTSLSFFGLLAASAWAGGIKHPSDYGDTSGPGFSLSSCGSTTKGGVIAQCFQGDGPSPNDFLFTFSLATPASTTSITSVTFTFDATDIADLTPTTPSSSPFGLFEDDSPPDCNKMNVKCTPPQVTFTANALPLATGGNTFLFGNFTGDLSGTVTAFFSFTDTVSAPQFSGDTTSSSVNTPEPSQLGLLIAGLGSLIAARRKRNS